MNHGRYGAFMASIALAMFSTASAEVPRPDAGYYDHPTRSYGVQGFLFFKIVGTDEGSQDGLLNAIKRATFVDDTTAEEFRQYAKSSLADLHGFRLNARDSMICGKRGEMNVSQLAAAFRNLNNAVEARREQLVRGSETTLGAKGMRNFERYLSNKDREAAPSSQPDPEKQLAQLPPKQMQERLARYCNLK